MTYAFATAGNIQYKVVLNHKSIGNCDNWDLISVQSVLNTAVFLPPCGQSHSLTITVTILAISVHQKAPFHPFFSLFISIYTFLRTEYPLFNQASGS